MAPTYAEAAALGALQGLTEFLPISSDGHLALGTLLFRVHGGGLALNVTLHAGTLLATLVVLWRRVGEVLMAALRVARRPSTLQGDDDARTALTVLIASVPTAVVGLLLRERVEAWTSSPLVVGLGFLGTGAVLLAARWAPAGERAVPSLGGALLIGLGQGLAVLPGLSRSGSTISLALHLGVRRDRAFELSMLMSLPAVAGALLLELPHAFGGGDPLGPALLGCAVSFGVGVAALLLLRGAVVRGWFPWFAVWVVPLGVATLAMARAWP